MDLGHDGEVTDDFKIMKNEKNVHVLNSPSLAATSYFSIADEIVKYTSDSFDLK